MKSGTEIHGGVEYNYRRAAVLEGTFPKDAGYFIVSAKRVCFGWGVIEPEVWPGATCDTQPEPPGLDEIAKARRIPGYWRIESLKDGLRSLQRAPFCAAFPVTHDWFYAADGQISMPSSNAPVIGTHTVAVIGCDIESRLIHFLNSWGPQWGRDGRGTMSFEFFETYLQEAWGMLPGTASFEHKTGYLRLENGFRTPIGALHVTETYDAANNERMAWAIVLERERHLDIQDIFVKPAYRGRGLATTLVQDIFRVQRERASAKLPLRGLVHPIDARLSRDAIAKLACALGLGLVESRVPWAQYLARPVGAAWKIRSRRNRR